MQPASSVGKAAALLMKAGKFQKASHTLAEALKSGASSPAMHLQLAECYLETEDYEAAVGLAWLIPPCFTFSIDLHWLFPGQECMPIEVARHPNVAICWS